MTPTESTFVRLLVSLEEFAAQESTQLAAGNIALVRKIQERAAPVVAELVRLGRNAIPTEVHSRVVALVNRRMQNKEHLDRQVGQMRDALGQTQANLRRIGQIASAYGRRAKPLRTSFAGGTHDVA
jgi:hypothetical protein